MGRGKKAITIRDVARTAGVSVSTVSRVLNDKDDVAPETYEKVQSVIRRLGYTSSLAARSMRSCRTGNASKILRIQSIFSSGRRCIGTNISVQPWDTCP
jgi:DNA-binding LacI/PurR family transcriptional regulator